MNMQIDKKLAWLMSKLIHRIVTLDRNEKACHGVTLSQHYTMEALYRKRAMTMKQLSCELNLAISTLTRIVDVLVRDGFIIRRTHETDRRKVIVELTEKGLNKARRLRECTQFFWKSILHSIPDQKKPDLVNHVKLLLGAMKQIEGNCLKKKRNKQS
ncbi:MarR family transcriptional regulator [bacterium]|nr:MarR family transcriptional regulator [bacterium]